MIHTGFCSSIKGFPDSERAELFRLFYLWIWITSYVWVTAKVCDKNNEARKQRKMQFLQAKEVREDVAEKMGPR